MKKPSYIKHIRTSISGRYAVQEPSGSEPFPLFVGFHGYGEEAETQLAMMQKIPGVERWFCCAIQALHPFYPRTERHGASWMTSQDRELRIQENVRYVNAVLAQLKQSFPLNDLLVYHGFSQGTAMACRVALLGHYPPSGVLLLGGDIPPELSDLKRMGRVCLARGRQDRLYSFERWKNDRARLEQSQVRAVFRTFHGGHGGSPEYYDGAGEFLRQCVEDS